VKRTLFYGVATAAVLAALGAGFGMTQCTQPSPSLYGPPPTDEPSESVDIDDPVETLYGPPSEMGSPKSPSDEDSSESEDTPTALYGPPPK